MKKEQFEKLKKSLTDRVNYCEQYLGSIRTDNDLENLTLKQAKRLKDFCRNEQGRMDRILRIDLYHIIGMANLSASQLNTFVKLIKEYSKYRSDIKNIASHLDIKESLSHLTAKSKYKVKELGDLELVQVFRDGNIEEDENIEELTNSLVQNEKLENQTVKEQATYEIIDNKLIKVKKYNLKAFLNEIIIRKVCNSGCTAEMLEVKARSGQSYAGISWVGQSGDGFIGRPQSEVQAKKLFKQL